MKKLTTLLVLLLCLALALPCTAEEAAYVPGETTKQIFADAWNSGKMIKGDMKLRFDMNGEMLGMTEEEQQILDAVAALLDSAALSAAAGKIEDGVRLEMEASLQNANGGDDVTADIAMNLTPIGVTLESGLIEGQKVTAKWETLLAMAGLSDSDIGMIMILRDIDWETTIPQVLAMAEQYMQLAAQIAAPYGETIGDWASTLTTETFENVEAEGYPTAAAVVNVYVTAANAGDLITRLATQLKADTTLSPLVDMLLAETGESITTAQLCDALIAEAAEMTDTENPVMITLALDANGLPLYGQFFAFAQDGAGFFAETVAAADETGALAYAFNIMTLDAQSAIVDAFSISGTAGSGSFDALMQVYADGAPIMGCEYIVAAEAMTTKDGQPGMNTDLAMTMNAEDADESVQMVMSGNVQSSLTADGGEVTDVTMNMDMYIGDQAVTLTAVGGMSVFPTADGLSGSYGVSESAPAIGLDAYGADVMFSTKAYDPAATAALSEFVLDTATAEDMNTLAGTLMSAAQLKLTQLMQAIPAETLTLLMGE